MPSERYEILLPLKYNDGAPVEPEKFQQTRRELVQKFGALTMEVQPISGIWIFGGQEHRDELIRFIVDTETSADIDAFFSAFKTALKTRFRQIDIWITAQPIRII
ncbi:MAG: hypothetical protein H0W13_10840 [Nitrospirales bacterium]|nr:hypothetical protein [Nitrospirales bacterium]